VATNHGVLPDEIMFWQYIYDKALEILTLSNYHEIRTPIIESTNLFKRSIGNETDIVNKEMYSFIDQGKRNITLRPEGTACIARSFISNKLYANNKMQKLWYLGPMFRYERPQNGRQRQFYQLGIECIGSKSPMADTEVIRLANLLLQAFECPDYNIEINSIGNIQERTLYKEELIQYLLPYTEDLDLDSQKRLITNPLRILDSKNIKTLEILTEAPSLENYLHHESKQHFNLVCEYLNELNIKYTINNKLVRGIDYYNYTAFEVKTNLLGSQDTLCGGGRYDSLIQQLGGPSTPAVGWAIGIERLLLLIKKNIKIKTQHPDIYIVLQGQEAQKKIWAIIPILEKYQMNFEMNFDNNGLQKQIKKANKSGARLCLILGNDEIFHKSITLKWLNENFQETIYIEELTYKLSNINKQRQKIYNS